jgi:hypothetical protein
MHIKFIPLFRNVNRFHIAVFSSKPPGPYQFRNGFFFPVIYTGRFTKFSTIINMYNKKTKGPTLMELFTATGKLKKTQKQ